MSYSPTVYCASIVTPSAAERLASAAPGAMLFATPPDRSTNS